MSRSVLYNLALPCDVGSPERVITFPSMLAKEVNRSVLYKVHFPCDLRSADGVGTFASKYAKEVNRSFVYKVPCHVVFDVVRQFLRFSPTQQNRRADVCCRTWVFDVIFNQLTDSQCLLRRELKSWTEVCYVRFILLAIRDELTGSQRLLRIVHKRWTEV